MRHSVRDLHGRDTAVSDGIKNTSRVNGTEAAFRIAEVPLGFRESNPH